MSVGLIPMSESVRKNGFQSPLNKYQILTWVALLWSVLVHYLVLVPSYPTQRDQTYIAVQYAWFYIIGIPTFFYVSTYDTTARYLRMKLLGIPASSIGTQELRYCDKCEVSMAPKTKHCGWCKKCVGYFDHHCLYLNVCITSRNHQSYIMLLLMVSAASCFQCIYAIHRVVHQGETDFVAELEVSLFAGMSEHSFLVLLCLFSLIPLGVFFCTFVLFVFHLYLIMTGTTTYTYVMKQRNIARNEAGMQEMDEGSGTDIEMAERRSQQHHHQHQQPTDPASDSDESIEGLAPIREEEGEEKRNNGAHTLDTGNNDNSDEEIQYDHHKDTEQSDENVQDVEVGPSATPMKAVDDDTPGDPLPPPPLPPQQRPPARGLARESNTHQGKKKKPVNEHKRKNPCYRFPHRKKKCSCFRNCVGAVNSVSIDPVIPGLFISSLPAAYKKGKMDTCVYV